MNGDRAITCFYIISGFLMALILDRKYSALRYFYLNRALRIYPPYLAALAFSIFVMVVIPYDRHDPVARLGTMVEIGDWVGVAWATISNLTLIGIDWTRYAGIGAEGELFFPRLAGEGAGAHNILFVPQGWTLALELQFYLLAPFILRLRTLWLFILTLFFLWLRHYVLMLLSNQGLNVDESSFFPLQLQYFLLGCLAYRFHRWWSSGLRLQDLDRSIALAMVALSVALIFLSVPVIALFDKVPFFSAVDAFYITFAATVPFLFKSSERSTLDKWVGEFSYPVYLIHFAVIVMLASLELGDWIGEVVLVLTFAVSGLYIVTIDRVLQVYRARVARRDPAIHSQQRVPSLMPESWRR